MTDQLDAAEDHKGMNNVIHHVIPGLIRPSNNGAILQVTDQYSFHETYGGLAIPANEAHEKKYSFAQVLHLGPAVDQSIVQEGDIIAFTRAATWRIPDGLGETWLYRGVMNDAGLVFVLPNLNDHFLSARASKVISESPPESVIEYFFTSALYASGNRRQSKSLKDLPEYYELLAKFYDAHPEVAQIRKVRRPDPSDPDQDSFVGSICPKLPHSSKAIGALREIGAYMAGRVIQAWKESLEAAETEKLKQAADREKVRESLRNGTLSQDLKAGA